MGRVMTKADDPSIDDLGSAVRRFIRVEIEAGLKQGMKDSFKAALKELGLVDALDRFRLPARAVPAGDDERVGRSIRPLAPDAVYVTRKQAALLVSKSVSTINRWIRAGLLKAYGPELDRIKRFELERFMDEHGAIVAEDPADPADEITAEANRLLAEDDKE
jgi:hypothetical protein